MKRALITILLFAFAIVLIGCNGTTTTAPTTQAPTTQAPTTQAPTTEEVFALAAAYAGSHTVSAMGSDVLYEYYYIFNDGAYSFRSDFVMNEEAYVYEETGTYEVEGNELTFTPAEGDPYTGTLLNNTEISVFVKASAMASRTTARTLTVTTLELSGIYDGSHTVSAMGSDVLYEYYYEFTDGDYTFRSDFVLNEEPYVYEESGTYTIDGTTITFTPTEGDPYTGTIHGATKIDAQVKASAMASRSVYRELILREGDLL